MDSRAKTSARVLYNYYLACSKKDDQLNKEVETRTEKDDCDPVGRILDGFHRFKTTKFEYDNATQP